MPSSIIQRSFSSGEIAPSLFGRADLTKFAEALKTCRNFLVQRHGGVQNRPGTRFIQEVKDSTSRTYLLKFVYNDEQSYVLEAGHLYFRIYHDGGYLGIELATPYAAGELAEVQYIQSADVMTLTHVNHPPHLLKRVPHPPFWVLDVASFDPKQAGPGLGVVTAGTAGTKNWRYQVTAISGATQEESLPNPPFGTVGGDPTEAAPNLLTWPVAPGASEYNVFRETFDGSGFYGFIGVASAPNFPDVGRIPDESFSPPTARNPFQGTGNQPRCAAYHQQRLLLGGTLNKPETIEASRTGGYYNFTQSRPLQDDDAFGFTLAGRQVNAVRHMLELSKLVILTFGGAWALEGGPEAPFTPTAIHPSQFGYNGAALVMPALVGPSAIFVQARGSILRDLRYELEYGFSGKDLTLFSPHLFAGRQIERMDYAEIPHSIIWAVRSDGVLLGLTYVLDQDIWGWHRHDTVGAFEDVVSIPEGDEDAVYVIVRRTIQGQTRRYIERFASRRITDLRLDALFLDSFLSYDGRNQTATTLKVEPTNPFNPDGWLVGNALRVTASADVFSAADVGNVLVLISPAGDQLRVTVTVFTSATVVQGYGDKDVPESMQPTPNPGGGAPFPVLMVTWEKAVDEAGGLEHLEGQRVSILGDGNVYPQQTVTAGRVPLDRHASVIHVGLPITADFETLDLDVANAVIRDRRKLITSVALVVEATRGVFVGPDADHLLEVLPEIPDTYGEQLELHTGLIEQAITARWHERASVFVRQSDPLPLTILTVIPSATIGG